MTRVHSHLHVYTAIPQIIIQNVIIRAVKYGSNLRTTSNTKFTCKLNQTILLQRTSKFRCTLVPAHSNSCITLAVLVQLQLYYTSTI